MSKILKVSESMIQTTLDTLLDATAQNEKRLEDLHKEEKQLREQLGIE